MRGKVADHDVMDKMVDSLCFTWAASLMANHVKYLMFTHLSLEGVQAPTVSWTVAEGDEIIL